MSDVLLEGVGVGLSPVSGRSTVDAVLDQLQAQVSGGSWPVGERIPAETDLAAQLGVSRPAVREAIRIGDLEIRYLTEGVGGCRMGCFEMHVAPNGLVPPPHSHPDHEELVYVLEGTLRYRVGESIRDLGPGDSDGNALRRGALVLQSWC